MKKLIVLSIILSALLMGCTASDSATKALRSAGYSDIKITGYNIFGCSEDDFFHTGFRARGADGTVVKGTVCQGILKGSTIRLD